jgi:hypothetical protein
MAQMQAWPKQAKQGWLLSIAVLEETAWALSEMAVQIETWELVLHSASAAPRTAQAGLGPGFAEVQRWRN